MKLNAMKAGYLALMLIAAGSVEAVTSTIIRQKTSEDLLKGKTDAVVVNSQGTIRLALQSEKLDLAAALQDVWTINTIVADPQGAIYAGTSPHGKLIRVRDGKADVLYPKPSEGSDPNDPNAAQPNLPPNEHTFAIALDVAGRVLAGVSGQAAKLIRLGSDTETLFENDKVQYIFAIMLDAQNNIYLATGPNGQLWKLDAFGQNPALLCTLEDKNILCLAMGADGALYAGTDTRGIVYKIRTDSGKVEALYDSDQDEITAIAIDAAGTLYAAATSGNAANQVLQAGASLKKAPGKPDSDANSTPQTSAGGLNLKPANSNEQKAAPAAPQALPPKAPAPKSAGCVYKISPDGFVTNIFVEPAVFYSLLSQNNKLLLGVGPAAKLFSINPATEERAIVFEQPDSSQVTALAASGSKVYLALANPAGIVRLSEGFSKQGVYTSDVLDAGQPAHWGKVQLDAEIPQSCDVLLSVRSGNIKDANDAMFSPWSPEVKMTAPVVADCPIGRFCQYRLTLKTGADTMTPTIREIAVANVVPNLPPQVLAVAAQKIDKLKPFAMTIQAKADDVNKDQLDFAVEMRRHGRTGWILLKDKLDQPKYEWDTRTVEDGRYEIRVTASDRLSNDPQTALTGSRVSDIIIVDNTAPAIADAKLSIEAGVAKMVLTVKDDWSVVAKVQYALDSDTTAVQSCLPVDGVYDTTQEEVVMVIADLKPGAHVLAVSVADDMGNTAYKTWDVEIKSAQE